MQLTHSQSKKQNSPDAATRSQIVNTYRSLNHWHSFQFKLFWEGIIVGIFSGLVISLFRFLLTKAEEWRTDLYEQLTQLPDLYTAGWFAALLVIGAVLYKLTIYEPMAGGSGIPQVKGVILGFMRMNWFRVLWVKLAGGVIGLGAGLSLGREGPSIQLGAVTAQGISRFWGRSRMEERYLITSGAGAGLAAAFNAPLAGVIFSLEELHRNFSAVVLLPAMTAALTATFVSRVLFGRGFIFSFYGLPPFPHIHLLYAVAIAVIAGLCGVLFNTSLLKRGSAGFCPAPGTGRRQSAGQRTGVKDVPVAASCDLIDRKVFVHPDQLRNRCSRRFFPPHARVRRFGRQHLRPLPVSISPDCSQPRLQCYCDCHGRIFFGFGTGPHHRDCTDQRNDRQLFPPYDFRNHVGYRLYRGTALRQSAYL